MSDLKMYHFEYKGYGLSVTTMATSEEAARGVLGTYLGDKSELSDHDKGVLREILEGRSTYRVTCLEPGELLWTERC